jgi:hypothetical protein
MEIGTVVVAALALLIPISAILLNSAVGKAIAQRIGANSSIRGVAGASDGASTARLTRIEHEVQVTQRELREQIRELEEHNEFLRQLIEKSK